MKISIDVYTKNLVAAYEVLAQAAADDKSTDVRIHISKDYDTNEFEYANLMFETDHKSPILDLLDEGDFARDYGDL